MKLFFLDKSYGLGFTLAELLISLAILGVIATFTIPKVLTAQQTSTNVSKAKEAIGMVSGAYSVYKMDNTPSTATDSRALTPHMNYVRIDTTAQFDEGPGSTGKSCNYHSGMCLRLHNGGTLQVNNDTFASTANTSVLHFYFDPDGKYDGTTADNAGKGVEYMLFFNGRITTVGNAGTFCPSWTSCPTTADPSWDPGWLTW